MLVESVSSSYWDILHILLLNKEPSQFIVIIFIVRCNFHLRFIWKG
jgi:hypothetical protein